jgi:hypothetical protein
MSSTVDGMLLKTSEMVPILRSAGESPRHIKDDEEGLRHTRENLDEF